MSDKRAFSSGLVVQVTSFGLADAGADAQQEGDPFQASKAVTGGIAALTAGTGGVLVALGMVGGQLEPLPPHGGPPVRGPRGEAHAGGPPSGPATRRPAGEVGNSNTQLCCQIDSHPPTNHCPGP